MDFSKQLGATIDPLSGPSWQFILYIYFLYILGLTACKLKQFFTKFN